MKTIMTKYLPATKHRGARIKAYDAGKNSITIPYPHNCPSARKHRIAVQAFCKKYKLKGLLVEGFIKDGSAFVFADVLNAFTVGD